MTGMRLNEALSLQAESFSRRATHHARLRGTLRLWEARPLLVNCIDLASELHRPWRSRLELLGTICLPVVKVALRTLFHPAQSESVRAHLLSSLRGRLLLPWRLSAVIRHSDSKSVPDLLFGEGKRSAPTRAFSDGEYFSGNPEEQYSRA